MYPILKTIAAGAALLSFITTLFPAEQTPADNADITSTVEAFHNALIEGDAAKAMSMLANDALIIESGMVQTRGEYESKHLREDIAFARSVTSTRTSFTIGQQGDTAWTTSTFRVAGSFEGKPVDSVSAELVLLGKRGEGW